MFKYKQLILVMDIFQELEEKSKTHPNLCKLWKKYLLNKLKMINNDLIQCKNTLETMKNCEDMDTKTILLLYNLNLNINHT